MSIFDRHKVKLVLAKIEVIKDTAEREGRFSLFHTRYARNLFAKKMSYETCERMFEIVENNDELCKIPYNVGIAIDNYIQNNRVFIHRVNLYLDKNKEGIPDSKDLYSMMVDGLENHGHANAVGGSAFSDDVPSLNLTMSPLEGFTGYVNLVNSHKGNDAIILASFPDDYFNKDGSELDSQGNPVVIKKSDLTVDKIWFMSVRALNGYPVLVLPFALITNLNIACQLFVFHFAHWHCQTDYFSSWVANQAAVTKSLFLKALHYLNRRSLTH